MSRYSRYGELIFALALAALVGWQVIVTKVSDEMASSAPRRALAWDADNPDALLSLARQQLTAGHPRQAATSAHRLLQVAPLQAQGFVVLARVAAASGDTGTAERLFPLALRRAPRNKHARAWVASAQLQRGDYRNALHNISILYSFAPGRAPGLLSMLGRTAGVEPKFATALGQFLASGPAWRWPMLSDLVAHASLSTVNRVFSNVQSNDTGLSGAEARLWFNRLEKAGHWDEAYRQWRKWIGIDLGQSVPLVFNGGFERAVTGVGFGWYMDGEPGVEIARTRMTGAIGGYAAQATFRRRRANHIGFTHDLLLLPGRYRLSFRARAQTLHSDRGLQWDIYCIGDGRHIAESPRIDGSFGWKTVSTKFSVPAQKCPAQRLALANPGAGGSGKVVSGRLWFDDFRITPIPLQSP